MPAGEMPFESRTQSGGGPLPGDYVVENGRLRCTSAAQDDCNIAVAAHLSLLSGVVLGPLAFLLPLVFWISNKDRSAYRADHCAEALNVGITGAIGATIVGLTWWLIVPAVLWAVWLLVAFIGMIRAAVAASHGNYFRYPMTIRFVSG